jgi:hypothetical protein
MDESPKQLIRETKKKIPIGRGRLARYDYERCGVYNIFMASEPLGGKRIVKITERRTKKDWAEFIEDIERQYKSAKKITLIMDNLNTHKAGSLYESFSPQKAKALWDRFNFVFTPKHGSWLNVAEIELNVLIKQCLNRRIDKITDVIKESNAWQKHRNNLNAKINWLFSSGDARIKLKRLYPTLLN